MLRSWAPATTVSIGSVRVNGRKNSWQAMRPVPDLFILGSYDHGGEALSKLKDYRIVGNPTASGFYLKLITRVRRPTTCMCGERSPRRWTTRRSARCSIPASSSGDRCRRPLATLLRATCPHPSSISRRRRRSSSSRSTPLAQGAARPFLPAEPPVRGGDRPAAEGRARPATPGETDVAKQNTIYKELQKKLVGHQSDINLLASNERQAMHKCLDG